MTHLMPSLDLARIRDARSGRVSSWDQRGRNQDNWIIGPGQTRVIADLDGPGAITHLWLTQFCRRTLGPGLIDPILGGEAAPVLEIHAALGNTWEVADPDYYRKVLLRVTYDGASTPAVLVPLGDFFGVGHSMPANYASAFFTVTAKPEEALHFGGSASLNSYLPMPFGKHVLVELINENDVPYGQYFHVDYELYRQPLPDDVGYLHAAWRRSDPCPGWGPDLQVNSPETNVPNLDGSHNYVVLETEGVGHYIGCNLSVFHRQGSWWGEGDDMIFIDDDTWPPSIHGTGTEDYFNHAWGMQRQAYPWHGAIIHEGDVPGYAVSYRFHGPDPVRFSERIRVTIEHGHANHLSDDWASTAYWYQQLPSPAASILPLSQRLPNRPPGPPTIDPVEAPAGLRAHVAAARAAADRRQLEYLDRLDRRFAERTARSANEEIGNRAAAKDLRGAIPVSGTFRLDGRVAVITGSGTGIGREIALTLAGAGAAVVLAGRDESHLVSAAAAVTDAGGTADLYPTDIADVDAVERLAAFAIDRHGRVDILVNNAGQFGNTPAEDMSDEDWRRVIDVNLSGTYWCCRTFGRLMLEHGSGAIVNVASISGVIVNTPQPQIAYNVSKAGVIMLTRTLAAEWAARGVRVNAVSPGYIATTGTVSGAETPGWGERWRSLTPMDRMGKLEDVARAVQYLVSDDAGYTTGANLIVDGGYTLW